MCISEKCFWNKVKLKQWVFLGHMKCQGTSDWLERELIAKRKFKRFPKFVCYKKILSRDPS